MKSVSIWAIALAATMSVACDNRNINDDTAVGRDTAAARCRPGSRRNTAGRRLRIGSVHTSRRGRIRDDGARE